MNDIKHPVNKATVDQPQEEFVAAHPDDPIDRAPTGELHHASIESHPGLAAQWARQLGVTETEVRQLAAQVGPVFVDIERALHEREARRTQSDAQREAMREGHS
jgi:hypothetical protein